MSKIECPLCGRKVNIEDYRFHREIEEVLLGLIKKNHPQWANEGEIFQKWLANYKVIFCPN